MRWKTGRYLVGEHLGQGSCKCKGPVVKACVMCLGKSKEACMVGVGERTQNGR